MKHTVTEYHLSGGAQGLIINVPSSDVVNILVRFNSGYQFADQSVYEVPHVMEHLLATVTRKYAGPNQFMIEAQKNGAYVNATTSVRANGYVYECADFELDRILGLVEEQLVRPLFVAKALAAEIGNVREELTRSTTQHGAVCNIRLNERAYPGQTKDYEARLAQLDQITLAAVEGHYHRTYTAANARFYVAGSFGDNGAKVLKRLERVFAQLPQGERLVPSRAIGRDVPEPIVTVRDIGQIYYALDRYAGELDERQQSALRVLGLVLTGGFGSRILGEARQRGLAYGVSAGGYAEAGNSAFGFGGYVTPPNATPLFELMARQLRAVAEGGVTTEELAAAQTLGVGSIKRSHQTAGDMLGWYVNRYDRDEGVHEFYEYLAALEAVTRAEVAAVAKLFMTAPAGGLSLVGPVEAEQAGKFRRIFTDAWK